MTDAVWVAAHPAVKLDVSVNPEPKPTRPVAPAAEASIWGPIRIERSDLAAVDDDDAHRVIVSVFDDIVANVRAKGTFVTPALCVPWAEASLTPDHVPLVQIFKRWIATPRFVEDLLGRGATYLGSKPSFGKSFFAHGSLLVELRSFDWQGHDWLRALLVYLRD
jgi:hypothetical protein